VEFGLSSRHIPKDVCERPSGPAAYIDIICEEFVETLIPDFVPKK